jgi:dolichyl-phosphate beta-glucosyltransferase
MPSSTVALRHILSSLQSPNRHDGSSDSTAAAEHHADADIRVVGLERNGGRRGALHARGRLLLLADADGARRLVDIELLLDAFDAFSSAESEVAGIVMGIRAHLVKTEAAIKMCSLRSMTGHLMSRCTVLFLLMHNSPSFATFSCTVCTPPYASEASDIYTTLRRVQAVLARHGPRAVPAAASRDVYIQRRARLLSKAHRISVVEVLMTWYEVPGSKLSVVRYSLQMMLRYFLVLRASQLFGRWSTWEEEDEKTKGRVMGCIYTVYD